MAISQEVDNGTRPRAPRFHRPSVPSTIAILVATLAAFFLTAWAYPTALPYLTDLGSCDASCEAAAMGAARARGMLYLAPFALAGWLLYALGSSRRAIRAGTWVILFGGYVVFFPVVYWAQG